MRLSRSDFVGRAGSWFFVFCLCVVLFLGSFMFHMWYWSYGVVACWCVCVFLCVSLWVAIVCVFVFLSDVVLRGAVEWRSFLFCVSVGTIGYPLVTCVWWALCHVLLGIPRYVGRWCCCSVCAKSVVYVDFRARNYGHSPGYCAEVSGDILYIRYPGFSNTGDTRIHSNTGMNAGI